MIGKRYAESTPNPYKAKIVYRGMGLSRLLVQYGFFSCVKILARVHFGN